MAPQHHRGTSRVCAIARAWSPGSNCSAPSEPLPPLCDLARISRPSLAQTRLSCYAQSISHHADRLHVYFCMLLNLPAACMTKCTADLRPTLVDDYLRSQDGPSLPCYFSALRIVNHMHSHVVPSILIFVWLPPDHPSMLCRVACTGASCAIWQQPLSSS